MTEDRVQIIVRTTSDEREQIKELAENKDTSMNQFIIDAIFENNSHNMNDSNTDSTDDIMIANILKKQLDKKDEQIENLQNIVDQQQQLTLQSNQQIEHLQIELSNDDKETKKNKTNLEEKKEQKQGFFSRLFNK